jgi:hypothetical protein
MRRLVVLPQPLGPSSVVSLPSAIDRSIESTAVKSPKTWLTATNSAAVLIC